MKTRFLTIGKGFTGSLAGLALILGFAGTPFAGVPGDGSQAIPELTGSSRDTAKFWALDAGKNKLAKFKFRLSSRKSKIEFNGRRSVLKGKPTRTGKTEYFLARNVADRRNIPRESFASAAKVISNASGFKIRDARGRLVWKVKISGKSVKISDNNANRNPYILRRKEGGQESKVWDVKTRLGRVKLKNGKNRVMDGSGVRRYFVTIKHSSLAPGVLLLERIPETYRYIIMAELYQRKL